MRRLGSVTALVALALSACHQKTAESEPVKPPVSVESLALEAREQFERGNYAGAERAYRQILKRTPHNLHVLSNLGVTYFRAGKLQAAETVFKQAIAVTPEDDFSHCTLGIVYYHMGNYDETVNELTKALAINPKNATAHNYLGITAMQKGWLGAAQAEHDAAVRLDPAYEGAPAEPHQGDYFTPLERNRLGMPGAY